MTAETVEKTWPLWARFEQFPPVEDWRVWLLMGGRGAGKTRAGAEWVRGLVEEGRARRVALVGPTLHDVREVMIGGPSGLLAVADRRCRPRHQPSRRRVAWPNGAVAYAFSAEDPDSLRGPQFDAAWCDEIGAWAHGADTWNMLMLALRLGEQPRLAATTTPRACDLVRRLAKQAEEGRGGVRITRSATSRNGGNLAPGFVATMEEAYAGTVLGRQELGGELVEDPEGALWTRAMIEAARMAKGSVSGFERVVAAVDPPAGAGRDSAACGIVVAGMRERTAYVLADASVRGLRPMEWAERAVAAARAWGAGAIVAEANQGGEMVRQILETAGAREVARIELRHAVASKLDRARPVSALYDSGRVKHVGVFPELEDELCALGAGAGPSPDRADALVWAVNELLLVKRPPGPRIYQL